MNEQDLARALKLHAPRIADARADLDTLYRETWRLSRNEGPDLPWSDWVALSALLLEFRPSLIIELGRGIGSSTSLFQYWSQKVLSARIVSLCRTTDWRDYVVPALEKSVPLDWDSGLDARVGDILDQDYPAILNEADRVLVLWDAHGLEIAGAVIDRLLPTLEGRDNIVVAHDMRDARYFPNPETHVQWLHAGDMFSTFAQIGPIAAYCAARDAPPPPPPAMRCIAAPWRKPARSEATESATGISSPPRTPQTAPPAPARRADRSARRGARAARRSHRAGRRVHRNRTAPSARRSRPPA